jgi:hypothetical protein
VAEALRAVAPGMPSAVTPERPARVASRPDDRRVDSRLTPLALSVPAAAPAADRGRHAGAGTAARNMPRSRRPLFALAGTAALLGALFLVRARRSTDSAGTPMAVPVHQPDAAGVAPAAIAVDIPDLPPAATLLVDGQPATLPLRLPGDGRRYQVAIAAPGFHTKTFSVEAARDQTLRVELEALPSPKPVVKASRPSPPAAKPLPRPLFKDL